MSKQIAPLLGTKYACWLAGFKLMPIAAMFSIADSRLLEFACAILKVKSFLTICWLAKIHSFSKLIRPGWTNWWWQIITGIRLTALYAFRLSVSYACDVQMNSFLHYSYHCRGIGNGNAELYARFPLQKWKPGSLQSFTDSTVYDIVQRRMKNCSNTIRNVPTCEEWFL